MRFRLAHQSKPYTFQLHSGGITSTTVDYDGRNVTIGSLNATTPLLRERKGREFQLLANALLVANQVPAAVTSRESPDFEVRLASGDVVYVEVTEAIQHGTARQAGDFHKLQVTLANRLAAITAPYQSTGYSATFYFGLMPQRQQIKRCVEEIVAFLKEEDVLSMVVPAVPVWMPKAIPQSYPVLASHNVFVMPSRKGFPPYRVHAELGSSLEFVSFSPTKKANSTIMERLDQKRGKATGWSANPLWLVIALSDTRWQSEYILASVQAQITTIKPFTKVLIASGSRKVFDISQKAAIG